MTSYLLHQLSQMDASTLSSYLPSSVAQLVPYALGALTLYLSLMSLLSTGRFFFSIVRFFAKWGALAALGASAWATWNGNGDQVVSTGLSTGRTALNVARWGWHALDAPGRFGDLLQAGQGKEPTGARRRRNAATTNAGKSGFDLDDILGGDHSDVLRKVSDSVLNFVGQQGGATTEDEPRTRAGKLRKEKAQEKHKAGSGGFGFDPLAWAGKAVMGESFGQAKQAYDQFAEVLGGAGAKGKGNRR